VVDLSEVLQLSLRGVRSCLQQRWKSMEALVFLLFLHRSNSSCTSQMQRSKLLFYYIVDHFVDVILNQKCFFLQHLHISSLYKIWRCQTRQFRRVNEHFVELLQAKMEKNTTGSYSAVFVVAKDVCSKQYFKLNNLESFQKFLESEKRFLNLLDCDCSWLPNNCI
jgi:hypothetical protein